MSRKYFLRHPYADSLSSTISRVRKRIYKRGLGFGCMLVGISLLILAAADFYWTFVESKEVLLVHKYVLINDASGSMVDHSEENGIGKNLGAALNGNKAFLHKLDNRSDGSKDYVGAIVFSNDAFILSYLVDDPTFVERKLFTIDYRMSPLSQGTMIDRAVWSGIVMVLNSNKNKKEDYFDLQKRFFVPGDELKEDDLIDGFVKDKKSFEGSSLIIFTDGFIENPRGSLFSMSLYKLFDFCRIMGIRVYFLSVEVIPSLVDEYCLKTGGFSLILGGINKERLEGVYDEIASSQANEKIIKEFKVDRSFSDWLAVAGLSLVSLGLIFQNSINRSFTEV